MTCLLFLNPFKLLQNIMFKHSCSPCQAVCNLLINHILLLTHTENRVMKGRERWGELWKKKRLSLYMHGGFYFFTPEYSYRIWMQINMWGVWQKDYNVILALRRILPQFPYLRWIKCVHSNDVVTPTCSKNCHMDHLEGWSTEIW